MKIDELRAEAQRQGAEYSRKVAEEYETFWNSRHWDFVRRERVRWMLQELICDRKCLRVLEVGCGIGFTTLEVARSPLVASVLAIDTAELAIQEARRLSLKYAPEIRQKVTFEVGDFFTIKGDEIYDLLYMHAVIEHIPNTGSTFDQAYRLLKRDGCFMVNTPNYDRLSNRLLSLLGFERQFLDPYHLKELTLNDLLNPPPGWRVRAFSGRGLLDEVVVGGLLSLGSRRLFRAVQSVAQRLARLRLNHLAGRWAPRYSGDLVVLYTKRNTRNAENERYGGYAL